VPLHEARGPRDGPTVLLVAGVHPGEYTGIEALRRLAGTLPGGIAAGRLLVVPCLAVPAFFGLTPRVSPVDGGDAGRLFPGRPAGSHTERLVHLVWDRLARSADYVVDVHGGELDEEAVEVALVGRTGRPEVDARAEALARALGLPILVRARPPADPAAEWRGLRAEAARHGIPAVLAEAGSHGVRDEGEVGRLVAALRRGLGHLGLLVEPGAVPPVRPPPPPRVLEGFAGVFAPVEGYWTPAVRAGDAVRPGQPLGELRTLLGAPLRRVTAAREAVVLVAATAPPRRRGDILFGLGLPGPAAAGGAARPGRRGARRATGRVGRATAPVVQGTATPPSPPRRP
jgi:predicted deacylase